MKDINEDIRHTDGRIVVKIDMEYKNSWTFDDGRKIRLERKYECFDEKYTRPVNAIVISAEYIPSGAEILIHHNCTHDVNRVFDYKKLSGAEEASTIKYYSIREDEAFAWRKEDKWEPLPGFDFALRVFKPYNSILEGVEPVVLKNTLFMLTGKYKNQVGVTIQASDYQIVFQDVNGREGNLIRIRTEGDEKTKREPELVLLHNEYTKKVFANELLIGLTKKDAKTLTQYL